MNDQTAEKNWYALLQLTDGLNRRVKEAGWREEDKRQVMALKDRVLKKLLMDRPSFIELQMFYVPYFRYSMATKDKAGALMRSCPEKLPFEYFLSQVPPSAEDVDVPEKATVEIIASFEDQSFSFHMPSSLARECGLDVAGLPKKPWISSEQFHHAYLEKTGKKIEDLLDRL